MPTKGNKFFAVHPGEILKTEFMEPLGLSAYALTKALDFPGIYDVVRGDRAISADTAIRLGKYFGLPAQFWLNLQNDYDLRLAEGSGVGKKIEPRVANRADIQTKIDEGYAAAQRGELIGPDEVRSRLQKLKRAQSGDQRSNS